MMNSDNVQLSTNARRSARESYFCSFLYFAGPGALGASRNGALHKTWRNSKDSPLVFHEIILKRWEENVPVARLCLLSFNSICSLTESVAEPYDTIGTATGYPQ